VPLNLARERQPSGAQLNRSLRATLPFRHDNCGGSLNPGTQDQPLLLAPHRYGRVEVLHAE
jgi:hypothetical protein